MKIIPLVISGGIGSRLWPASRKLHPKPFIELKNDKSFIKQTYERVLSLDNITRVYTITNDDLYYSTKKEFELCMSDVEHTIITEPFVKNTAAAIALGTKVISEIEGKDSVILVLPADHVISPINNFSSDVKQAVEIAHKYDSLVVFGVKPNFPNTGYGYIQREGEDVIKFHEKPSKELANEYVLNGFLWNAGLFCFKALRVLTDYQNYLPKMVSQLESMEFVSEAGRVSLKYPDEYNELEEISFDHAIIENTNNIKIVECSFEWSDVGTWSSFSELYDSNEQGNVLLANTVTVDTKNTFIRTRSNKVIATAGIENLIIVDSTDALLVMHKDHSQEIKNVVSQINEEYPDLGMLHDTVYRPWGTYTVLEGGDGFKLKRIVVYPGQSLSLQMHHHRSEHWIVVSGIAKVVNDNKEVFVRKNESTYIRAGHKHRLTNPGMLDCVLIEVQVGDYLEEDDIVRFEDVYGRD